MHLHADDDLEAGRADSLAAILRESSLPMELFLSDVGGAQPPRVPGTAVFMTSRPDGAPLVLLHHLKHNKVLHEQVRAACPS